MDAYISSNNYEVVDHAKRLILDLYDEEFGKIDPTGKAARIFAAIPAQLNSNASQHSDKAFTENTIYEHLLSDKLATNPGCLYENVVVQMLTSSGNKLFYHVWPTESGKHNYGVDFLLSRGTKIMPMTDITSILKIMRELKL